MGTVLEEVERRTTNLYGTGSAVSVDKEEGGWVVRCWDRHGIEKDTTGKPRAKAGAITIMKRRLARANFLRLNEQDGGDDE